ncbi:galactonate dehydratase [Halobellus salinisoli]|uniref:galactonate dehydratase n=1 Tax=Halobellus salinisoli TaxID=3108500 RepID=UPI00300AEC95
MKITEVEPIRVGPYLFVRIHTDAGTTGLGEAGAWAHPEATTRAIAGFERQLLGTDPLRIRHHFQALYRNAHFRGAVVTAALSAIDIALWDIAGKYNNVPVYELLGGPTRTKARAYPWVLGETTEELVAGAERMVDEGFTAIGHLNPLTDHDRSEPYFETHSQRITAAVERVGMLREVVGPTVDLCLEIHRRLDPAEAIVLGRKLEEFTPMFYEDPTRPDNFDAMARIARKINLPIATGERLQTIHEFEMLLSRDAVDYIRPDVCLVGGITQAVKVAALAEARYVDVVPHTPLSPIGLAASLQLAAVIPNFAIQEYMYTGEEGDENERLIKDPITCEDGFLIIPDRPGIGVELNGSAVESRTRSDRQKPTRLHEDGSVVDQ